MVVLVVRLSVASVTTVETIAGRVLEAVIMVVIIMRVVGSAKQNVPLQ